jgi:UPF0716 protein FxsA
MKITFIMAVRIGENKRAFKARSAKPCSGRTGLLQSTAMNEFRLVFKLLDRDFLFKLIFAMLLYSLVPLAEIFVFIRLGDLLGGYLVMAAAATLGLVGVLIALRQIRITLDALKAKIREGEYPGKEFVNLLGILLGSVFLLTPGFITDFFGFLLLIPPIREGLGRMIARRMDVTLKEVYEYLRLYDL